MKLRSPSSLTFAGPVRTVIVPLDRLGEGESALAGLMVGKLEAYAEELKFDLGGVRYGDPEEDEPAGPFMGIG